MATIVTTLGGIAALLYLGALLVAMKRSNYKRELYALKALIVAYFFILATDALFSLTDVRLMALFRPALATLFLLLFLSLYVDIKRRS